MDAPTQSQKETNGCASSLAAAHQEHTKQADHVEAGKNIRGSDSNPVYRGGDFCCDLLACILSATRCFMESNT